MSAALISSLDTQTNQFLANKIPVNGKQIEIKKLAEVLEIQEATLSQELKILAAGSNDIPNLKKLALYAGLSRDISEGLTQKVTFSITDNGNNLQVNILFDETQPSVSRGTHSFTVDRSEAKELAIDPVNLKLIRSSITLLNRDGDEEKVYSVFDLSEQSRRVFRTLCSKPTIDGHRLNDLSDLIADGCAIYEPVNTRTELKIILQRQ